MLVRRQFRGRALRGGTGRHRSGCPFAEVHEAPAATTGAPASAPSAADPALTAPPATLTSKPLTGLEKDPAVRALRTYYAAVMVAVNKQDPNVPELKAISTTKRYASNARLVKSQAGLRSPGPVPFTPVSVRAISARAREVRFCGLDNGFAIDPKTGRPKGKRSVIAAVARVITVGDSWKIDSVKVGKFSCSHVRVK